MKILMLHNTYLVPGGEDSSCLAEIAILRESGHEVEYIEEDNHRIAELGEIRTGISTVWSQDSYRRIDGKLRAENFDVMHVQNFFPLWSPSVYYAAARNHVPVVQTLHNYRLMCVNSLFFRDHRVCEDCLGSWMPWRGVAHACYRNSRAGSAVVALMVGVHRLSGTWKRKINAYIAVSEFERQKYIAGGFPETQIVVKPNFIHPSPQLGPGGGKYALFVGRLSPEKGIHTLLEAWKSAQNPIHLKVVGEGSLSETVMTVAKTCDRVQYFGRRPLYEVLELMGNAEFLVFPSEWYETQGRTIMEAFAKGTPVVASKLGPPASMVVQGETGYHFQPGNVAELRERVEWCSRNLAEVRSLRTNARRAFEASYTGPANLEMLIRIYEQALQSVPERQPAGDSQR